MPHLSVDRTAVPVSATTARPERIARPIWTIALAAGSGSRLASVTGGVPKQFWHRDGQPSLLDRTIDRLQSLSDAAHRVTIVDVTHRRYLDGVDTTGLGTVILQPCNRGTAAGVLLPLLHVLGQNADATVVISPTDHGVGSARVFLRGIARAVAHVHAHGSDVVVFGTEPSHAATDYGWITPAGNPSAIIQRIVPVGRFVEKPPRHEAERLLVAGGVWNTMVVVARAATLFDAYLRHLPMVTSWLQPIMAKGAGDRDLERCYASMPAADFSRDLLGVASSLRLYTWPASMRWSDLGTPARLGAWLEGDRCETGAADRRPRGPRRVEPAQERRAS